MGKEGIISEHPTLKIKYMDPEMAGLARDLKAKLEHQGNEDKDEAQSDGVYQKDNGRTGNIEGL